MPNISVITYLTLINGEEKKIEKQNQDEKPRTHTHINIYANTYTNTNIHNNATTLASHDRLPNRKRHKCLNKRSQ